MGLPGFNFLFLCVWEEEAHPSAIMRIVANKNKTIANLNFENITMVVKIKKHGVLKEEL
jgi:hypothetical protein